MPERIAGQTLDRIRLFSPFVLRTTDPTPDAVEQYAADLNTVLSSADSERTLLGGADVVRRKDVFDW